MWKNVTISRASIKIKFSHNYKMKNDNQYHAVNCRVPVSIYDTLQKLVIETGKTTATTVSDAIEYYIQCVKSEKEPTNPTKSLKIDRFAWNLNK